MDIIAFETRKDEIPYFLPFKQKQGLSIKYIPDRLTEDTVPLIQNREGVSILGKSRMNAALLDKIREQGVKYLTTRTAGYNHIDISHAKKIGLRVSNVSYSPNGVAEYTVMLILMCLRKYKQALFRGNVNDYSLQGLEGRELRHMTVGIIGTGDIGETVIKCLSGFGCRILASARRPKEHLLGMVEYVEPECLCRESDIISLHVPLTETTRRLINADTLAQMKQGVILINTARGELMDTEALIEGLESKKIGALGLDVFENEDGIFHQDRRTDILNNRNMAYIRQFPNVTMTQHMAFYTREAVADMATNGIANLLSMAAGACPAEL